MVPSAPLRLTLRNELKNSIPINVAGVLPETTAGFSDSQIGRMKIGYGNRSVELGDLFSIRRDSDSVNQVMELASISLKDDLTDQQSNQGAIHCSTIVWEGNLSAVHWLGAKMTAGRMIVLGNVGRHLGSQIVAGMIDVVGDVDDYVGCENRGGRIRIGGDAGNWVGGAYPGTKIGARGGTILVAGNAGAAVGSAMRRGLVVVGGSAQRLAGWNMRAGTIVVGGAVGPMVGAGMVRGSVVLPSHEFHRNNEAMLPPSFTVGGRNPFGVLSMLDANLLEQTARSPVDSLPRSIGRLGEHCWAQHHGDLRRGGRGEVLIAAPP